MRLPPQLRVALGPSRLARAFVVVVASAAACVTALLPWPWWLAFGAHAAIAAWAAWRWRSFGPRPPRRCVTEVVLSADRLIAVRTADGRLRSGFVRDATYVSPSLTGIVWQPDDAWGSRTVLVLPDMLPADDFRRLRVLLRYGRSEDVAATPASHA